MLLSGSIESDNHKGLIPKFEMRSDSYKFLHLYSFMILSGNIESDNYNGVFDKFEKRSDLMTIENVTRFTHV